jgi:hypothetical protein
MRQLLLQQLLLLLLLLMQLLLLLLLGNMNAETPRAGAAVVHQA